MSLVSYNFISFISFRFSEVLRQATLHGKHYSNASDTCKAAVQDGIANDAVRAFGGLSGTNCARGFKRFISRTHDLVDVYEVLLPVLNKNGEIVAMKHPILLPHEVFSYMSTYEKAFNERVLGGSWQKCHKYWNDCRGEPWFASHPARNDFVRTVPLRLYGDDAEDLKNRSSLVLTWSSASAQHIRSEFSRFVITVLPLDLIVTDLTLKVLYGHVVWSFMALLNGYFPRLDPMAKRGRQGHAQTMRASRSTNAVAPKLHWPSSAGTGSS